jgi:pheromone a factor receptor
LNSPRVSEYIVAGHRFDIYEDYGCAVVTYNTPLAYVLFWSWPLIISVVSACYGGKFLSVSLATSTHPGHLRPALATRAFLRRRKQLKDLDADFDYSNYWRLIAIASVDFFFVIPLSSWNIALGVLVGGVRPWISWDDTHWGYSRVDQYPKVSMVPLQILSLELDRWSIVFTAFTFFGFFGFAEEARKNYRLLASTLAKPLGYTLFTEGKATSGPVINTSLHFASHAFPTQQTESKSDSDSFSDKPSISTAADECDVKLQPYYSTNQPASFGSLSPHINAVPQVPEPVLELPLARFVPDATKAVHPNGALDRV